MRLTVALTVALLAGCGAKGDEEAGRLLLRQYGCGTCHRIPGVAAARGNVGPPLDRLAKRVYLAGSLPNTPENLVGWIRHPQKYEPRTAMPDMQVTEEHARRMVAYLRTLK
jgi:cytochrome c1